MRQENESSVEEILESIKKVIARDTRANAVITRQKREDEGVRTNADATRLVPEPADAEEAEEILDLGSAAIVQDDHPDDSPQHHHDSAHAHSGDDDDALQSDGDDAPLTKTAARNSMRDNLAALAMLAEPGVPPQIVRTGETSLEGLTRELLRPMLAEWLDENLPDMVEKLVKAEISRIAGKRD